jgi:hypothetical protein
MDLFNLVTAQGSYLGGSNSNIVTCRQPGYLLVPAGWHQQHRTAGSDSTGSHPSCCSTCSFGLDGAAAALHGTNLHGISAGEVLQHQLIAQAPAGSFTAADGCFVQQYTPAPLPMAPAAAEQVNVTEESVQLECMVLQQQLSQKQQLAQQLAQHRTLVQPQQQVMTLQHQLPQQARMATVYDSSAGSNTVQLLQPGQQQQLLGVTAGSAAGGFNIAGVDPMFGSSCSFASACNVLTPASPSEELVQASFLQAQQQQQQGALDGAAAALQLLPSSSSDGMLLAALHSQDSLDSFSNSYTSGSDVSGDTAGGDSRAGFKDLAGTGVFYPPSLDRGMAPHGSYRGDRDMPAGEYSRQAARQGSSSSRRNSSEPSADRGAAPQDTYTSDRNTGRAYGAGAAAYGSRSGDRDWNRGGSWQRRDGVLVVPCTGKSSPRCGPEPGAAAAAYNAHGAAAASSGCSSPGGSGGSRGGVGPNAPQQQQQQQQRWGRSQQRGFWPRGAPHSSPDNQRSTPDQMSFFETIMSKSNYSRNLAQKQQQQRVLPCRSVGRYNVSLLGCSGGFADIDLEQLCSSASMNTDIIELLGGYRRRTVDVVQNQQYGHLSTRARHDLIARSSGNARGIDVVPDDDRASRGSDAGHARHGTGYGTPRSRSYRSSFEAASARSAAAVAEAAAIVAAFAAAAAEGGQPTSAVADAPGGPAGMQGCEATERTAADNPAGDADA